MEITEIGNYGGIDPYTRVTKQDGQIEQIQGQDTVPPRANRDRVELSGKPTYDPTQLPTHLNGRQEQSPSVDESAQSSGCVAINAAKLARILAAAKTRAQVQAVIAQIQADLRECEAGKEKGYDVDEGSVAAAKNVLQNVRK